MRRPHFPHLPRPEPLPGLMLVVRAAAQRKVIHVCPAAVGKRHEVVYLEEAALSAASRRADECALSFVAGPDLPLDYCWHVPRTL